MEYKYGMLFRPFSIGTQPKGFIRVEGADKFIDGYWDILVYDRELIETEIESYELEEIK